MQTYNERCDVARDTEARLRQVTNSVESDSLYAHGEYVYMTKTIGDRDARLIARNGEFTVYGTNWRTVRRITPRLVTPSMSDALAAYREVLQSNREARNA